MVKQNFILKEIDLKRFPYRKGPESFTDCVRPGLRTLLTIKYVDSTNR